MALQTRVKLAKLDAPKFTASTATRSSAFTARCISPAGWTTAKSSSSVKTKFSFKSPAPAMKRLLRLWGLLLRPGVDWLYPYYRDRALCLLLGVTPLEMLLQAVGAKDDPSSGGRQMPSHWGHPNGISSASPPAPARNSCRPWALRKPRCITKGIQKPWRKPRRRRSANMCDHDSDEIVFVSSRRRRHQRRRILGIPERRVREETSASLSGRRQRLRHLRSHRSANRGRQHFKTRHAASPACMLRNATAPIHLESYAVCKEAVQYVRERRGPALIHAHVTRPYSHSLSDDEKLYKTPEEREAEAHRDPLSKFSLFLDSRRHPGSERNRGPRSRSRSRSPRTPPTKRLPPRTRRIDSILVNVYSPDIDPTSSAFEVRAATPWRAQNHGRNGRRDAVR